MTRFAARLGGFYGALFLVYGVHVPYLPVWLDWRGLSAGEIALVTAAPFFVRLAVTPLVAYGADRYQAHRRTVIGLAVLALAMALVLSQSHGFWPIMAAVLAMTLATTTIMPLTETIAVAGVRVGGLDYGRMRLWGSLTFIVASFGGGMLVDALGASVGVWLIIAGTAATMLAALALPELPKVPEESPASERSEPAQSRLAVVRRLAGRADFLVFLAAVGAVQGAHALFYAFGVLHWRSLGISGTWVGLLWTIGVLAEVGVFAYSRAILARVGAIELMIAGGAAATLRWAAMSLDPPLAALVGLQLLHALSYGAAHLGAIHFIAKAVPQQAAGTGQALYATVAAGVAMGAATLAAGPLYAHYAGHAYLAMAAQALAGTVAGVMLWRLARPAATPPLQA
ncbi:MAG: MFS transporter [Pseudomonadota bacterium]